MTPAGNNTLLEAQCLRIYCLSGDRAGERPLHEAIVEAAQQAGMDGASVLHGKAGFSRGGFFFEEVLAEAFIDRQPIVVEIVALTDRLNSFLPYLHDLVRGRRLITIEPPSIVSNRPRGTAT